MPSFEIIIEKLKKPMIAIITITNILLVLLYIQIININPILIKYLQAFIQTFISFFLIYRFHPFKKDYSFNKNDNYFIFGSAIVLLTNLGITQYTESFLLVPVTKQITEITGMPFQVKLNKHAVKVPDADPNEKKSSVEYDKNEYHITI